LHHIHPVQPRRPHRPPHHPRHRPRHKRPQPRRTPRQPPPDHRPPRPPPPRPPPPRPPPSPKHQPPRSAPRSGAGRTAPRTTGTGWRRPANPRLLRQRLFVFVVVTLLVALGIAVAQGCQGPARGLGGDGGVQRERHAQPGAPAHQSVTVPSGDGGFAWERSA
ncbi:hypothetical protein QWJ26_11190, partial [Streptomyces sp. CSDS2]|nr:hypothetical protein [Streptomyces sp. CSDS2]